VFLIDIIIIYFIKCEFDEFKLNLMNVYVWYDIVWMFCKWCGVWWRHIIFRKGDTHVEIIRIYIGGILTTLVVHWIRIDEVYKLVKSRRRFIWPCPRFETWAYRNRIYGLTLCIWKLYLSWSG